MLSVHYSGKINAVSVGPNPVHHKNNVESYTILNTLKWFSVVVYGSIHVNPNLFAEELCWNGVCSYQRQASKQENHQQEYQVPYRCSAIWSLFLCLWSNKVDKMRWYVCAFLCMLSCFSLNPYICFVFSLFRWHYKQDQRKKKRLRKCDTFKSQMCFSCGWLFVFSMDCIRSFCFCFVFVPFKCSVYLWCPLVVSDIAFAFRCVSMLVTGIREDTRNRFHVLWNRNRNKRRRILRMFAMERIFRSYHKKQLKHIRKQVLFCCCVLCIYFIYFFIWWNVVYYVKKLVWYTCVSMYQWA